MTQIKEKRYSNTNVLFLFIRSVPLYCKIVIAQFAQCSLYICQYYLLFIPIGNSHCLMQHNQFLIKAALCSTRLVYRRDLFLQLAA